MADYSQALKEAYASAPPEQIIFDTLEIIHPAFVDDAGAPTPARIVRGYNNIVATLEPDAPKNPGQAVEFTAISFEIKLPGFAEGDVPQLVITIDNVGRELVGSLEQAAADPQVIQVIYRPYLVSDLSAPQMDPPITMYATGVDVDVFQIQITCTLDDVNNWPFPHRFYQPDDFPGLVR
jgi:Domain of unknown function (DUF1833)